MYVINNIIISNNLYLIGVLTVLWVIYEPEEFNLVDSIFWNVKKLYSKLNLYLWPVSFACGTDWAIAHIVDRTCP